MGTFTKNAWASRGAQTRPIRAGIPEKAALSDEGEFVMNRKKLAALSLAAAVAVALAGCTVPEPDREALGWEEDWVAMGDILAAEGPEGFTLQEEVNNLSGYGFHYAIWSRGEQRTYENAAGKEAPYYDVEVYLLVHSCKNETAAANMLLEWEARERLAYECGENTAAEGGGRSFTVVPMLAPLEGTVPYSRGLAALCAVGNYAVSVEVLCREGYECDTEKILTDFLSTLHYNDNK